MAAENFCEPVTVAVLFDAITGQKERVTAARGTGALQHQDSENHKSGHRRKPILSEGLCCEVFNEPERRRVPADVRQWLENPPRGGAGACPRAEGWIAPPAFYFTV